jgi:hypothetical protein
LTKPPKIRTGNIGACMVNSKNAVLMNFEKAKDSSFLEEEGFEASIGKKIQKLNISIPT